MNVLSQKPLSEILLKFVVNTKMRWWPFWGLSVPGSAYFFYQNNFLSIFCLIASAIVYFVVLEALPDIRREWLNRKEELRRMMVVILTFFMALPLFIFLNFSMVAISHGDGTTTYMRNQGTSVFYNAFTDSGWGYASSQTVSAGTGENGAYGLGCISQDTVVLTGAMLRLDPQDLQSAHTVAGSESKLKSMIASELCRRVEVALLAYTPSTLPSTLALELKSLEEVSGMNRLGVNYDGEFVIVAIHAYKKQ